MVGGGPFALKAGGWTDERSAARIPDGDQAAGPWHLEIAQRSRFKDA